MERGKLGGRWSWIVATITQDAGKTDTRQTDQVAGRLKHIIILLGLWRFVAHGGLAPELCSTFQLASQETLADRNALRAVPALDIFQDSRSNGALDRSDAANDVTPGPGR